MLLGGDLVRKNPSSEPGLSREHREINLSRIGFVAAEIARNGEIAICAPIAPYAATRRALRETIEAVGGFVVVCVSPPPRDVRSARPQGTPCEGEGRPRRGIHRHRRPVRAAGHRNRRQGHPARSRRPPCLRRSKVSSSSSDPWRSARDPAPIRRRRCARPAFRLDCRHRANRERDARTVGSSPGGCGPSRRPQPFRGDGP